MSIFARFTGNSDDNFRCFDSKWIFHCFMISFWLRIKSKCNFQIGNDIDKSVKYVIENYPSSKKVFVFLLFGKFNFWQFIFCYNLTTNCIMRWIILVVATVTNYVIIDVAVRRDMKIINDISRKILICKKGIIRIFIDSSPNSFCV